MTTEEAIADNAAKPAAKAEAITVARRAEEKNRENIYCDIGARWRN